jgi:segregation and condensation protein B
MKNMTPEQFAQIIEAALMVAGRPLTVTQLQKLFDELDQPETHEIKSAITALQEKYKEAGIEIHEVASGFQFQAKTHLSPWLSRLWEERAPRYSRAFLETLALVAYRQPITRAEVEDIRGVSASSHHFKTLLERGWIRILGYRDVPGKPALYGTTKEFLDYFNLKNLSQLPTLSELKDLTAAPKELTEELQPQTTSPEDIAIEINHE